MLKRLILNFGGFLAIACLLPVIIYSGLFAQENDVNQGDYQIGSPPVYMESGPIQEAMDLDNGSVAKVQTEILWQPILNIRPENVSNEDFIDYLHERRITRPLEYGKINDQIKADRGLNIIFNIDPSVPSEAENAMNDIEAYLEGIFSDPITVRINIDFDNTLPSGVLGATGVYTSSPVSWTTVRSKLTTGMDFNDFIQDYLPSGTIPVRYNGGSGTVTDENQCYFAWANYGAIGYTLSGVCAETSINPDIPWDYDPSNGVSGYCFKSVMIHEIGHALGFISRAEQWYDPATDIFALDIFRFQRTDGSGDYNPDNYNELTTAPRLVDYNNPNDDHNSNIFYSGGTDVEYRMSDGNPYQASHFRQSSVYGIMCPAFGSGQTFYPDYYKTSDLDMFDAIGWDYPPAPPDSIPPSPDPMTWEEQPTPISASAITMTASEAGDDTPPVEYYFEALQGTSSEWQIQRTYTDNGLDPNTEYSYQVKARDQADPPNSGSYSTTESAYTYANVPGTPLLSDSTLSTMHLDVNPNGNPAITEFAIKCSGSLDGTWDGKYVDASGYPIATPVWQTDGQWNVITIMNLMESTQYCFYIKARNADLMETLFGPESCLYTAERTFICGDANSDQDVNISDGVYILNYVFAGGDPPDPLLAGDVNCDFDVNVSDAVWIVNYIFGGEYAPCDTDGDGVPDC